MGERQTVYAWFSFEGKVKRVDVMGAGWTNMEANDAAIDSWTEERQCDFCDCWDEVECVRASTKCDYCVRFERKRAAFVQRVQTSSFFYGRGETFGKFEIVVPPNHKQAIVQNLFNGLRNKLRQNGAFSARAVAHFRGSQEQ